MSTLKSNKFQSFGLALREALNRKGVTPAWLSRELGKDKAQISRYLNSKSTPKRLTQLELTKPLGVEIVEEQEEWLLLEFENTISHVEEKQLTYSVVNYEEEKIILEEVFAEIETLKKLYQETTKSAKLSKKEKKTQLEMIKEKLVESARKIPDTKS